MVPEGEVEKRIVTRTEASGRVRSSIMVKRGKYWHFAGTLPVPIDPNVKERCCATCHDDFPLDSYYPKKSDRLGRYRSCPKCMREYAAKRRENERKVHDIEHALGMTRAGWPLLMARVADLIRAARDVRVEGEFRTPAARRAEANLIQAMEALHVTTEDL